MKDISIECFTPFTSYPKPMTKKERQLGEKNCMFQYATRDWKIYEDTWLITLDEANTLWEKYFEQCKQELKDWLCPQMCIRENCNSETDYSKMLKSIDYYDCEVMNNVVYRITKTKIK